MKDCTTCKYGFVDEQFGFPMCHHPKRFSEDCVDFNMHEDKEEPKKATGIVEKKLPDELEAAANRQAALEQPYKWEEEQDGSFGVTPLFVMSNIRSAFKAGAEWMAGQGGEIKGWLARHRSGELCLFFNKPEYKLHIGWVDEHQHWRVIDANLFPEIKFKDSPIEVIINIRKK